MKFIAGSERDKLSLAICAELGIEPTLVRRIVIDLEAGSAARVYFETFADDEKLRVALVGGLRLVDDPPAATEVRAARYRECRSCKAPILWVRTEHEKRMPLDAEPYTGPEKAGLFALRDQTSMEGPLAIAATPEAFADEPLFRSHFATCPNAALHRRSR